MIGSEKQIRWAEQILADARGTIKANIEYADANYEKYKHDVMFADRLKAPDIISEQFEATFGHENDARRIIDARGRITSAKIIDLMFKAEEEARKERQNNEHK